MRNIYESINHCAPCPALGESLESRIQCEEYAEEKVLMTATQNRWCHDPIAGLECAKCIKSPCVLAAARGQMAPLPYFAFNRFLIELGRERSEKLLSQMRLLISTLY